jgi:O-antigen/teichoic acid export membrane protein
VTPLYLRPPRLGRIRTRERPGDGDAGANVAGALSMLPNSLALIAAKIATLGLGFLFWLLAARLYAPDTVGLAAGVVAAVLLCVQLALLGVGSAVIALFPESRARPGRLLDTALTLAMVTGLAAGGLFLALAASLFPELGVVGRSPVFAVLFALMSALGTVGVVLDQASTTLRRGDQALVRGVLNGILSLAALGALAIAGAPAGSMAIFACWVVGGAAPCALGAVQLERTLAHYRYRPRLVRRTVRRLIAVGLPNHALTLADRAPALLLPVLITEVLSPTANAYWYAVWMMAWLVFVVPVQVGMTLFAEAADRPHDTGRLVTHGVRSSLAVGLVAAVGVAVFADVMLSLLGAAYAAAGATPLRVLVWGVVPLAFVQAYYARCRAARRLGEAVAAAAVFGALGVAASILAGASAGLTAMAGAWVASQSLAGGWAVLRLRVLDAAAAVAPPALNVAVAAPRLRGEEWA